MSPVEVVLAVILGSLTLLLILGTATLGVLDLIEHLKYRRTHR